MNTNAIRVHRPDELDLILAADRKRSGQVVLALESLEPYERADWEKRINRYFRACGCGSAAGGLTLAFLVGAALAVTYYDLLLQRPLVVVGLALLMLLAALGLGKTFGLWVARLRLRSTVASLRRRLAAPSSLAARPR